jgi:large subunit ribosomal protein L24
MRKIKKGDIVIVHTGSDKNRKSKVLHVFTKRNCAIVEGLKLVKKHLKPNPQKGISGGIVTREAPIHMSNLALVNPSTQKADKVGIRQLSKGQARYFKSNGEQVGVSEGT